MPWQMDVVAYMPTPAAMLNSYPEPKENLAYAAAELLPMETGNIEKDLFTSLTLHRSEDTDLCRTYAYSFV